MTDDEKSQKLAQYLSGVLPPPEGYELTINGVNAKGERRREPINPANVPHMSREELEDACACLKLMWLDGDTDAALRTAVLWELTEMRHRDNPEEIRDERGDEDVYAGRE